jgi:nucleotide-binding universal stress UspA family protein
MGYYEEGPPRHGHRTPTELAEDEMLAAMHGHICMPATEQTGPPGVESLRHEHLALISWADAHPLESKPSGKQADGKISYATPTKASPRSRKPKEPKAAMTPQTAAPPTASAQGATSSRGFRHLFRPDTSFKLLLAIENDDNAQAAIQVADALTARGAVPSVINAAEIMMPVPETPNSMVYFAEQALDEDFLYHRRRSLQALISAATGGDKDWPIASVVGSPSGCIIQEAEIEGSELIVMGIHQHGAFEQAIGENTATRVLGSAGVPVLGVRPALRGVPRRIIVATDFGDASREAAHIAANLADPGGCVILVHVTLPTPIVEEGDEGAALVQREGIEHAFLHLADEIKAGKSIQIETLTRTGDPGTELMAAARLILPDLITIASQRHHLMTRVLLGSVGRKVTREGSWSMLVTPPVGR